METDNKELKEETTKKEADKKKRRARGNKTACGRDSGTEEKSKNGLVL